MFLNNQYHKFEWIPLLLASPCTFQWTHLTYILQQTPICIPPASFLWACPLNPKFSFFPELSFPPLQLLSIKDLVEPHEYVLELLLLKVWKWTLEIEVRDWVSSTWSNSFSHGYRQIKVAYLRNDNWFWFLTTLLVHLGLYYSRVTPWIDTKFWLLQWTSPWPWIYFCCWHPRFNWVRLFWFVSFKHWLVKEVFWLFKWVRRLV